MDVIFLKIFSFQKPFFLYYKRLFPFSWISYVFAELFCVPLDNKVNGVFSTRKSEKKPSEHFVFPSSTFDEKPSRHSSFFADS